MAGWTTIIGIAAGTLTSVSLLPQLIKMIRERKATDISIVMLVTLFSGLALWIVYGIRIKDWPVIITNVFSLLVNLLIIVLRARYKQQGRD